MGAVPSEIEAYYDTVPRVAATTEEVGPFTLFVAEPGTGWRFYARPRLGLETAVTAVDVQRVVARQDERGLPRAIEWVAETTPSLLPAVRAALGDGARVEQCPLQVLGPGAPPAAEAGTRCVVLAPDDRDLALAIGTVRSAFAGTDQVQPAVLGGHPALIARGAAVMVAAYDASGRVVGGGTAAPRGPTSELMGIAVLPSARRSGHGAAITRALVDAVHRVGVRTVFLSAGTPGAAALYLALGFAEVGTACILEGERPGGTAPVRPG